MKIYKFNENNHDDLIEVLQEIIKKDNKTINGFEFDYDSHAGLFVWSNSHYVFYATPYYDDDVLPINVCDEDGEDIEELFKSFELPELKNNDDVIDCVKFYYKKIDYVTSGLNKRIELKTNIELINSVKGADIIKKIYSVDVENVYRLSDINVNKLLQELNFKYSDIIQSSKYNL